MINYRGILNDQQYEAVTSINGSLLISAGAGTGKTSTITHRTTYMIENGIASWNILLLTFTVAAAEEMKKRIDELLGYKTDITCGTFHSFAGSILKQYAKYIGYKKDFTILDDAGSEALIEIVKNSLGYKYPEFPKRSELNSIFNRYDTTGTPINEILLDDPQLTHYAKVYKKDIENVYEENKRYKKEHNFMNFSDMIINLNKLLDEHPQVTHEISNKYKYVMVDEYQDSNPYQIHAVTTICKAYQNLCVVGDDKQSIYKFQGSRSDNIETFKDIYPNIKQTKLYVNYRSSQEILEVANELLKNTPAGLTIPLISNRYTNIKPEIDYLANETQEALFVAAMIKEFYQKGEPYGNNAILYRTEYTSITMEKILLKAKIPYIKKGGISYRELAHIRDLTSFIQIACHKADVLSWIRVLRLHENISSLTAKAIAERMDDEYNPLSTQNLPYSLQLLELKYLLVTIDSLPYIQKVEHICKYYIPLMISRYEDHKKRTDGVITFRQMARQFRSGEEFLSTLLDVKSSEEDDQNKVTLSSIHASKGKEYKSVFVLSCVQNNIPYTNPSRVSARKLTETLHDELLLFYVAVTRAKDRLFLLYPRTINKRKMKLSNFINDKISQLCEVVEINPSDNII